MDEDIPQLAVGKFFNDLDPRRQTAVFGFSVLLGVVAAGGAYLAISAAINGYTKNVNKLLAKDVVWKD